MTEVEIAELEAARREAMLTADVAALDELFHDDMRWIHGSAKIDDKLSFVAGMQDGRLQCFRLEPLETEISIHGGTAIVTGIVEMETAIGGERRVAQNRFVNIWFEAAGKTRMIHWQSTRLPSPA